MLGIPFILRPLPIYTLIIKSNQVPQQYNNFIFSVLIFILKCWAFPNFISLQVHQFWNYLISNTPYFNHQTLLTRITPLLK